MDPSDSLSGPLPLKPDLPEQKPPDPDLSPPAPSLGGRRPPPPTLEIDFRPLARFLYSHNPFYCASTALVLWGLLKSFHFQGANPRPELLLTGLAGYALLLAAVGCLLVLVGQLWEDIRTIVLLIVLIFLAISMSFDEVLPTDLAAGRLYFLGGLAFSVVVSELVLRGVRLRLPALYRLPYYATLAMFFLYPLLLVGPWLRDENDPRLRWLLAGFSTLAGLVTLTLLPAARRGAAYVRDNGSPWQWPWYPWPLFVVLAVGVGLRTYAICVSFHPSRGPATMFEPYFLAPWLLAVNVLLLEIGIAGQRPHLLRWCMAAPLGLLLLSSWTFPVPASISLRRMLLDFCGCSPLFLMLLAVALLYAVALARRVPHAFYWLTAAMALLVVVGPRTSGLDDPFVPRAWPLLPLTAMQLYTAIRHRSGLGGLLAALCAIAALCIAWPATVTAVCYGAVPAYLLLAAMLVIGTVFRDDMARFLQSAAGLAILVGCLLVCSGMVEECANVRPEVALVYPGIMLVLAAAYGIRMHNRWFRAVSLLVLADWIMMLGQRGHRVLRTTVAGLDEISLGLACLLVGLTVSLWKIGLPQTWLAWWLKPPLPLAPAENDRGGSGP
jgi:hypothetical protein